MGDDIKSDLDRESFPSGHVAAKDVDGTVDDEEDDMMSLSMEEKAKESADDWWWEGIIVDGWNSRIYELLIMNFVGLLLYYEKVS